MKTERVEYVRWPVGIRIKRKPFPVTQSTPRFEENHIHRESRARQQENRGDINITVLSYTKIKIMFGGLAYTLHAYPIFQKQ